MFLLLPAAVVAVVHMVVARVVVLVAEAGSLLRQTSLSRPER
jgi:hypothetical protein